MTERKRLVREPGTARPRVGRLERASAREDDDDRDGRNDSEIVERRRARRGRPAMGDEVRDLNRGAAFMGAESAAIALDIVSRVLRRAVDRAFDGDYDRPGDIVRGVTRELDDAGYDLVSELRGVPRRLSRRFDDSLRSPRAEVGERERHAEREASPADSPAAGRRRLRRDDRDPPRARHGERE
jgi:hypothetical protein